jgi:hypothetical protein
MEVKWKTPNISLSIAYSINRQEKSYLRSWQRTKPWKSNITSINFRLSNITTRKGKSNNKNDRSNYINRACLVRLVHFNTMKVR